MLNSFGRRAQRDVGRESPPPPAIIWRNAAYENLLQPPFERGMGNGVATLISLSKQVSWPEKTPLKAFFGQDACLPLFSTGSEAKHARPQGGYALSWLQVGASGKTSF